MRFLNHPIKDYLVHWDAHMTTFWAPLIVGLIFLGLAIHAITQKKPVLCLLYIVLTCCCVGYLGFGDEIVSKLTTLYKQ